MMTCFLILAYGKSTKASKKVSANAKKVKSSRKSEAKSFKSAWADDTLVVDASDFAGDGHVLVHRAISGTNEKMVLNDKTQLHFQGDRIVMKKPSFFGSKEVTYERVDMGRGTDKLSMLFMYVHEDVTIRIQFEVDDDNTVSATITVPDVVSPKHSTTVYEFIRAVIEKRLKKEMEVAAVRSRQQAAYMQAAQKAEEERQKAKRKRITDSSVGRKRRAPGTGAGSAYGQGNTRPGRFTPSASLQERRNPRRGG
jgi:hypothetical protein